MDVTGCDRAWVEVDLGALAGNVQQLRGLLAPPTVLMAVIKADAYGHGAVAVAKTCLAQGVNWLAVATIPEAIELRQAGIHAPILVLGVTQTPAEVRDLLHWSLQPTLVNIPQALSLAREVRALAPEQPLPVHLKLDTGMSRLGTPWQEAVALAQQVQQLSGLRIASVYSHLATADDLDQTVLRLQQARFDQAVAKLRQAGIAPPCLHLANSAATLLDPGLHYHLVRVGLALYGCYPADHLRSTAHLRPALQVKARVAQVKHLPPGTGISYGHRYVTERPTTIAVVGIGYADGVPRLLSGRLTVLVRGQRLPQVGAITMDQLMIDCTTVPDLEPGEVVTLLGQDGEERIEAQEWADLLGTIVWEVVCGFRQRLPRLYY